MIRILRQPTGMVRHVFLTLAVLAIALKILIPPGFMAGTRTGDTPFALVLCTGQGAVTIDAGQSLPGPGDHDQAPARSGHEAPCVFAGLGVGAPPPALLAVAPPEFAAFAPAAPALPPGLAPGRGLAGPPLPARGPPVLLI